jgi:hypothetical protein
MLALPMILLAGLLLPALGKSTNCGGNSAALSVCKGVGLFFRLAQHDQGRPVGLHSMDSSTRLELLNYTDNSWTRSARYLVTTNVVDEAASPPQIVVVCDRPYDNVPQPTIWNLHRRNPAHAVGYSDGSTGLLTPAEFGALNKAGLAYADELLAELTRDGGVSAP